MANFLSVNAGNGVQGVSIDDTRRIFNFGERVAELAPQQSPFFVYLSKVAKKSTDDPVFKFLEQRHQWQRRNFNIVGVITSSPMATTDLDVSQAVMASLDAKVSYDKYGKPVATAVEHVPFILDDQVVAIEVDYAADGSTYTGSATHRAYCIASSVSHASDDTTLTLTPYRIVTLAGANLVAVNTARIRALAGASCQVIGSAFNEGVGEPDGWEDKLFDREGYCQIFKTGMNLFSGTAMATRYRGHSNEYQRIWRDKLMEHKMDIEHSMLFGIGKSAASENSGTNALRYSWGVLPYTEQYGKIYSMSYSTSGYDAFLDAMEDFFAPESGNSGSKLVLASRKVITYLNKMGSGGFLNNTVGSSQYRLDVQNIKGAFGHQVTVVNTIYGNLHFVAEPLLRGMWEDYCIAVDMSNLAYRPLVGNGKSRDTFIETNIQTPGLDGRKDQIITEAGLEISLPETHAILKFS
jgi:hypothetical protein